MRLAAAFRTTPQFWLNAQQAVDIHRARRQIKKINEEHRSQYDKLRDDLTESLSNILLGEKIPLDVTNSDTGEVIIPANRKITKNLLRKLAAVANHIGSQYSG